MYTYMKMIPLYEKILAHIKPGHENDEEIVAARKSLEKIRQEVNEDMREHLEVLDGCLLDVTKPPWCAFSDEGRVLAIMAAGRPGDVFKFDEAPKEADAQYLLLTQPHVIEAMINRIRELETLANVENRWTSVSTGEEPK